MRKRTNERETETGGGGELKTRGEDKERVSNERIECSGGGVVVFRSSIQLQVLSFNLFGFPPHFSSERGMKRAGWGGVGRGGKLMMDRFRRRRRVTPLLFS